MLTALSYAIFASTLAVSLYAIAATVAPRLDLIRAALRGEALPFIGEAA